jgi:hypothetical protein
MAYTRLHKQLFYTGLHLLLREITVATFMSKMKGTIPDFLRNYGHHCHSVAQFVEVLSYKPEGLRFDSRWCNWNSSVT